MFITDVTQSEIDLRLIIGISAAQGLRRRRLWRLENVHPNALDAKPGTAEDQPSWWNQLGALRVLA
jgi:hypothetical protein